MSGPLAFPIGIVSCLNRRLKLDAPLPQIRQTEAGSVRGRSKGASTFMVALRNGAMLSRCAHFMA
jgi:hypothetical protein